MNTGIFITVRTGSSRLPQKALMKVMGRPILSYLISRVKSINEGLARIFICTTDLEEDKVLCELAAQYGIECFQGDRENIINRHYQCAIHNNIDFIINVDGDDILCNPEYIKKIIETARISADFDIIKSLNLPFGTNSIGYTRQVLERILEEYAVKKIDTGWGQLLNDKSMFNIIELEAKEQELSQARMTLDYEEDFVFFKSIIESLFVDDKYIEQDSIIEFLRNNEQIININMFLNETYWENYNKTKIQKNEAINNVKE